MLNLMLVLKESSSSNAYTTVAMHMIERPESHTMNEKIILGIMLFSLALRCACSFSTLQILHTVIPNVDATTNSNAQVAYATIIT